MNYDLVFWKQLKPIQLTPLETYRKLNSRENLDGRLSLAGIADLPVDEVLARFKAVFPGFDPANRSPCFETPDGRCDVSWSKQHFSFTINGDPGDSLNPLVAIMREFGCPTFDPQQGKRYDSDHGLGVGPIPRFQSPTTTEKLERQKRYQTILSTTQQARNPERTAKILKVALGVCIVALIAVIWFAVKK